MIGQSRSWISHRDGVESSRQAGGYAGKARIHLDEAQAEGPRGLHISADQQNTAKDNHHSQIEPARAVRSLILFLWPPPRCCHRSNYLVSSCDSGAPVPYCSTPQAAPTLRAPNWPGLSTCRKGRDGCSRCEPRNPMESAIPPPRKRLPGAARTTEHRDHRHAAERETQAHNPQSDHDPAKDLRCVGLTVRWVALSEHCLGFSSQVDCHRFQDDSTEKDTHNSTYECDGGILIRLLCGKVIAFLRHSYLSFLCFLPALASPTQSLIRKALEDNLLDSSNRSWLWQGMQHVCRVQLRITPLSSNNVLFGTWGPALGCLYMSIAQQQRAVKSPDQALGVGTTIPNTGIETLFHTSQGPALSVPRVRSGGAQPPDRRRDKSPPETWYRARTCNTDAVRSWPKIGHLANGRSPSWPMPLGGSCCILNPSRHS